MNDNKTDSENVTYSTSINFIPHSFTISGETGTLSFGRGLEPKKIIFNGNTTIVYWNDGTKSVSTCAWGDQFDETVGFAMCLLKKMFGKKIYGKRLFERMLNGAERQVRK